MRVEILEAIHQKKIEIISHLDKIKRECRGEHIITLYLETWKHDRTYYAFESLLWSCSERRCSKHKEPRGHDNEIQTKKDYLDLHMLIGLRDWKLQF